MDAIRRAAANITAFKLDLKSVFEQFDTSGDGLLSIMEMASAFLAMGVKLDVNTMKAIFRHFDPDGSGMTLQLYFPLRTCLSCRFLSERPFSDCAFLCFCRLCPLRGICLGFL